MHVGDGLVHRLMQANDLHRTFGHQQNFVRRCTKGEVHHAQHVHFLVQLVERSPSSGQTALQRFVPSRPPLVSLDGRHLERVAEVDLRAVLVQRVRAVVFERVETGPT